MSHADPICASCGSRCVYRDMGHSKKGNAYGFWECSGSNLINEDGSLNWCTGKKKEPEPVDYDAPPF